MTAPSVDLRTNAKINLFLRVVGQRADGFHELESIFHGVGLADEMRMTLNHSRRVDVEMHPAGGFQGKLPELEDNLAFLAAQALADRGFPHEGVEIRIDKRIPIGGGLGGGSGNAAGVLVGLNHLLNLDLTPESLVEVAAIVGSDVPYCISGGTALVMGRGEMLTPLPATTDLWFVLGISNEPLMTADVYAAFDRLETDVAEARSAPMALALGAGDVADVAALLHNDLEPAAFALRPDLAEAKQALTDAGCLGACLTGSGPTLFGIVEGPEQGAEVAERVMGAFDRVEVARTAPECVEMA
jgi:4-diphosphocytidyl-2-C-methyl-D-erythritol kinase